jgi:hypothetical protein
MFKMILDELDTLEAYFNHKKKSPHDPTFPSPLDPDLDASAKKILARIPINLHIYIPAGIQDFYKQVEEFETWKSSQV